ncbi:WbqC family protein [Anaerosporobacter sp.]|uniref:WbqC family protein n=1 Tax=Anaerosporobacter sp. TaxID=1872529 RepID=UPI00286ECD6C|nr:WbqC family protein [Anaerosporobacter sp.]
MRVAISQPEHFPYLGYFQKMCACDAFVILDDVQFSGPRSFQNRNRYLNKQGEYVWFTVPVKKGSYFETISDVRVSEDEKWRKKLERKLICDLKFGSFTEVYSYEKLVDINMASIEYCKNKFNISVPMIKSSELSVGGAKADKIYNICKKLGADIYVAGVGSKNYMQSADFREIKVQYFYPNISNYESAIVYAQNPNLIIPTFQQIQSNPLTYCKDI